MIQNKQVNLWRGNLEPPTQYHIWLRNESQLLRYDEELKDWVVFLDSSKIGQIISDFMDQVEDLVSGSINGYLVRDHPVLNAKDIKITQNGTYIKMNDTTEQALLKLDTLLTTEIL